VRQSKLLFPSPSHWSATDNARNPLKLPEIVLKRGFPIHDPTPPGGSIIFLPTLQTTKNWIVLALAGRPRRGVIPLSVKGSLIGMTAKGKSFRKRQFWRTVEDELSAYYKGEVWISSRHSIPQNLLDDLEALLNSSSAKDAPHNGTEGVEDIYWAGTEAGLIGIPRFLGLIYATDGSQEKGNMGTLRHEGETGGFCKLGRDEEGSSYNRAEHERHSSLWRMR